MRQNEELICWWQLLHQSGCLGMPPTPHLQVLLTKGSRPRGSNLLTVEADVGEWPACHSHTPASLERLVVNFLTQQQPLELPKVILQVRPEAGCGDTSSLLCYYLLSS